MATVLTKDEDIVRAFRECAGFPAPTSAQVVSVPGDGVVVVATQWSQRDLERKEKVKFTKTYFLSGEGDTGKLPQSITSPPHEVKNELWNQLSPSGKLRAIVRDSKTKKGEEKQFIEIWNNSQILKTVDVTQQEKHGKIHDNDGFGCLEWSQSEKQLLYIAEIKAPKTASYFSTKTMSEEERSKVIKGAEFNFRESWGEQLTGYHHPVLCVLDWQTGETTVLEDVPDNLSAGQAVWSPDDGGVVFVGWDHEPFRLGVVYCKNRVSHMYFLDLQNNSCKKLSEDGWSARSPSFSPDWSTLVYLQDRTGFTHSQCSKLIKLDWATKENSVVVDIINGSTQEFSGLFTLRLPPRCWCSDGKRLVLHSQCRSRINLYVVNLEKRSVSRISKDDTVGAWVVMDVSHDQVIAKCSSPNRPPYLVIGSIPAAGPEDSVVWKRLDQSAAELSAISWKILQHAPTEDNKNPQYPDVNYETVLLQPCGGDVSQSPLLVFPHGGPQSVFSADFFLNFSFLAKCGFSVLLVNYRGSTGFGQDGVTSLVGNIGQQDVRDVQSAAVSVLQTEKVDVNRVYVTGGSHGGFLTTHLIGQYPGFYKAAAARNSVTNLVSMAGSTDIPDWVYVESGLDFDLSFKQNPEILTTLWTKSPLSHVDQVRTPLLVLVGGQDKRVPPKQSEEYYKALKARGVAARMLWYPDDCHPLAAIETEADCCVNVVKWFNEHA